MLAGIKDDVRIGVCDRMIENWTLADWETFKVSTGIDRETILPLQIEGLSGKSLLKKYYPKDRGLNIYYRLEDVPDAEDETKKESLRDSHMKRHRVPYEVLKAADHQNLELCAEASFIDF